MSHKTFNVLCKLANKNFNSILFDHCKFPIRRMIKILQSSANSKKISFKNCSFIFAKPILFTKDMRLECKIDFEKVKFNGEEFFEYFERLARSGTIETSIVNCSIVSNQKLKKSKSQYVKILLAKTLLNGKQKYEFETRSESNLKHIMNSFNEWIDT